ncbi:MAG: hypothetical protein JG767_177 [Deferribacteraceae bacterium]|nr:hypothetical protein [Deferribacteraceae bacterium]
MRLNKYGGLFMKKFFLLFATAIFLSLAFSGFAKEIKAGFIYVGPVGDGGWTYAHDLGRKEMEKLPFVGKSTYIESVPEGSDAERVITSLAKKGHNLIFTTSFGFMDPTINVAKRFKNVVFMHCSGYKTAENVGTYFGRMYEPRYLSGIIAGSMTKSNIIGYVAAFPIPEVIRGINAFTLGVRSVNKDAVVKVVWTQTWFDPGTERNAAESLLDVGADVLAMHQDTPATLQAAENRGKYVIGYNSDMRSYAPKGFLTAPVWNWGAIYKYVAQKVNDGTWKSEQIWWGMDKGAVTLAPISDKVPAEVVKKVMTAKEDIINGKFQVFTGPIKDQSGKLVLEEGKTFTDGELLGMNFFVEGVQGNLNN